MPYEQPAESGHDFEHRGRALARSLHDPLGLQGAVMFRGKERDGLFVTHDDVHAYEFTIDAGKQKAVKDGNKLAELIAAVGASPENVFKSRAGWFVTRDEPTAEQRTAINAIGKQTGERLYAISISTLLQRLCDSEAYIQRRDNAPFGSAANSSAFTTPNVSVDFLKTTGDAIDLEGLVQSIVDGKRSLLTGNFGVGKSHSLREVYRTLRKAHFRSGKLSPFPVHINLRDCAGLKTPAEILRRHAEEIGFDNPDGLISSWRAGVCVLLLDGFDEVIPTRWLGGVADLRNVRWEALSPVRRLVTETPSGAGIIVAGRSHYFSGNAEMAEVLGFRSYELLQVPDFDENQLAEFIAQAGSGFEVPDWVPVRPLLLTYLLNNAAGLLAVADLSDRSEGWLHFFDELCARESQMYSAVRPELIRSIVSRVALLARSRGEVTGPIDTELLRSAYVSVIGVEPDKEGLQLLMRLPGLASVNSDDRNDLRVFADRELADTAYAIELADFTLSPYETGHPLMSVASWANAATELGVEVTARSLAQRSVPFGVVKAAINARAKEEKFDAVMADLLRVAATFDSKIASPVLGTRIAGVYFEELQVVGGGPLANAVFDECVIERLDMTSLEDATQIPHFNRCIIGYMEGLTRIPEALSQNFLNTEIEKFSSAGQTTAGIMQLTINRESRIALTVLRKIFGQRGSARKEGALTRGLTLSDRPLVAGVLDELVSQGWLFRSNAGNTVLYVGSKERRKAAMQFLESPNEFQLR